jgi:hypothetical protein
MVDKFTKKWYENKDKLQHYFETNTTNNYDSYEQLVKVVLKYIINDGVENYHELDYNEAIQIDKLISIDYGDYQGTLIYIFPEYTYQPSISETYYTFVDYGSCSGCDTLKGILTCYDDELPTEGIVKDLMTLSLHLIQNIHDFKEI